MFRPSQLPSVSQFCRRVKTDRVRAMLAAVHEYLTRSDAPVGLSFVDGKPLPIPFWSGDRDARVGYATKGFARGYKLHAWVADDARIVAFTVRPMNEGEAKVARDFAADSQMGGLVLADANYDSQRLYQAFGARGAQLLTVARPTQWAIVPHRPKQHLDDVLVGEPRPPTRTRHPPVRRTDGRTKHTPDLLVHTCSFLREQKPRASMDLYIA